MKAANLRATSGAEFTLWYDINRQQEGRGAVWYAENLSLNLTSPGRQARAFIVGRFFYGDYKVWEGGVPLDLKKIGDAAFEANFWQPIIARSAVDYDSLNRPQIAIQVDGAWLIDPMQLIPDSPTWEPHNFNFDWML